MFFVVDFETSALTPWEGKPLSVGIVPVNENGHIIDDVFYERFFNSTVKRPHDTNSELTDTDKFWLDVVGQESDAYAEAWLRHPRYSAYGICQMIQTYVERIEPNKDKRFIAANPGHFDKMWMEYIFADNDLENPFHYRTLCLRSMRFGLEVDQTVFGSAKGAQESQKPHHALYDAISEAEDLAYLITKKAQTFHEREAALQREA